MLITLEENAKEICTEHLVLRKFSFYEFITEVHSVTQRIK